MSTKIDDNKPTKPHAVMVPVPAQGHVNPMFKIAKLLHHRGFHITFVNTHFNHRRLLLSRGPSALDGLRDFHFTSISDGLPPSDDEDSTQDPATLANAIKTNFLAPFRDLVSGLNNTAKSSVPPVTCIISDGVMSFTLSVAKEWGIPSVLFWTPSACGVMAYAYTRQIIDMGLIPLKDESCLTNGYLDTVIDSLPGFEGIPLKALPDLFRTVDPESILLNFNMEEIEKSRQGSAIIVDTFDELEHGVLDQLSSIFPSIFTIGPLHMLENQIPHNELKNIGSNLWKEDLDFLEWLDSVEPNSVIYVNFGSITRMSSLQLTEFAWGLANSEQNFLWAIRPDLVVGESAILPPEFEGRIKGSRGLLTSWCPQEKVLTHGSIGGFLTHCGWNSMLESVGAGVPMICWPAYFEQPTNSWFCCKHWGMGVEIESDVKRDEIEKVVRELIVGEKGKEMKKRAVEWKKKAEEACSTGSSYMNFEKMVNEILLCNFKTS